METSGAPPPPPESNLHSANVELTCVLNTLDLPIIIVGYDGKIIRFNQAAAEIFELTSRDVGQLPSSIRIFSDLQDIERLIAQVISDGTPSRREIQVGDRWFVLRIAPCPSHQYKVAGTVLTFTNVTAFRASIAQAIYDREYTKTILNTVPQPLVVLDGHLRVQTANRAFYTMFGVSRETTAHMPLCNLGNHDWNTHSLWDSVKATLLEKKEFKTLEVEGEFPAIGRRTFLFDACRLGTDKAALILVCLTDITERNRTQAALFESEQRYRTLFNSMDEGFCIIEMIFDENQKPIDYRFLEVNPAFGNQSGLKDARGKRMRELAPHLEQHWFDIYGKIALTGEPSRFENSAASLNRWYEVYAFRIEPAEAHRVCVVFNNITDRKRQEEKLEKMVAERTAALRETVGELEAFSYSIAHDMRAPLRGMRGFADLLMAEHASQLDPEALDYLRRIGTSAHRMDALIQDVLNYSKIIKAQVIIEPQDLDRLTREIIESYPQLHSSKAEIKIRGILPRVLGNQAFLTQCISNLLANAVKFVAPGVVPRVCIWAEEVPSPSISHPGHNEEPISPHHSANPLPAPLVRLFFEDNGIGIAPDKHARIFRMFERIHPAAEYEGTGIGLTIACRAAERMGGSIGFESELGLGSRFWIQLKKS